MAQLAKWTGIAGTVMSAGGALYSGREAKRAADAEADQLRSRATARRAEAQRSASEERRQTRFAKSRAQAVVAAGGGSTADPSIVRYMADLEAGGEYDALARLHEGYEEASGLEDVARARQREGKAMRKAGTLRAVTTALSGAESLFGKYGR